MKRLGCLLLGLLAGCSTELDPIESSDRYFSMSGYLDAAADTQWVRVEAVGRTFDPAPGPLDARVTLREAAGGPEAVLTQVTRTFETGTAHLFWTTADVAPGRTYLLAASRPDGAETRATVIVPDVQAVTVRLVDGLQNCPTLVVVEGADRLADVQARYALFGEERAGERYRISKLASLKRAGNGSFNASIFFGDDAAFMEVDPIPWLAPVSTDVTVAIATDDWPEALGLDLETALFAADSPRIENGVGFVGGVVTMTVPFVPGIGNSPPPYGTALPCLSDP